MRAQRGAGIEDTIRRNIAELRARAQLTQQALADEMYRRGVSWTRETVAQAETGNRRLGLTEAIALAASLDVPLARLVATDTATVRVGENTWHTAYVAAAVAGTAADAFGSDAFGASGGWDDDPGEEAWDDPGSRQMDDRGSRYEADPGLAYDADPGPSPVPDPDPRYGSGLDPAYGSGRPRSPQADRSPSFDPDPAPPYLGEGVPPRRRPAGARPDLSIEVERRRRPRDRNRFDPPELPGDLRDDERMASPMEDRGASQGRTAERIQRRLRLRVTADDIDAAARDLWSSGLEEERERRVADRYALTGGSLPTIRGHVSRELDRELEHALANRNGVQPHTRARDARPPAPQAPGASRRPGSRRPPEDAGDRRPPERLSRRMPGPRPEDVPPAQSKTTTLRADEAVWEASRLNTMLANKGYRESDVTQWWNFTAHDQLDGQTIAEAWRNGRYDEVRALIEQLPEREMPH